MKHIPVLLHEVISLLDPKPGKKYIDATIGMAGHAQEIVNRGGIVLGIDADPSVIAQLQARDEFQVVQGNFSDLKQIAGETRFMGIDGILFDLGLGTHQLDDPARGFSFQKPGPLDMRYDQKSEILPDGQGSRRSETAADVVNFYSEKDLVRIFYQYGEEKRFGKRIARAVIDCRKLGSIKTTTELFELIKKTLPANFSFRAGDIARRIFQSLRIAVNDELLNLEKGLQQALDLLLPKGKLAVISFHSLEDRIVKNFFIKEAKDCLCPPSFPVCRCEAEARLRILTKKPITAAEPEIKINSRAKSAKLRVAEKL